MGRTLPKQSRGATYSSKRTVLRKVPTPLSSTSISSPSPKNDFGLWKAPTPAGVPVMTAVPAGMVVPVTIQVSALGDRVFTGNYYEP